MRWRYVARPDISGAVECTMRAMREEEGRGGGRVRRGGIGQPGWQGRELSGDGLDFPAGRCHPCEKSPTLYRRTGRVLPGNEAKLCFRMGAGREERKDRAGGTEEAVVTRCLRGVSAGADSARDCGAECTRSSGVPER